MAGIGDDRDDSGDGKQFQRGLSPGDDPFVAAGQEAYLPVGELLYETDTAGTKILSQPLLKPWDVHVAVSS